jgi:predicted neuraminidase
MTKIKFRICRLIFFAIFFALLSPATLYAQSNTGEFIYETAPFPSAHASTIVELPNGDLLAAWFGGTAENRPDVAIWGSRWSQGKWTIPEELVRERETPCWNPVYFYTNDKRLWLYYKYGTTPATWSAGRKYSDDDGKTWSQPEHLPAGLYGPIRAKPLVLKDGTVVSGTSVESYRSWAVWIERSTDNGKTFSRIGPITVPENVRAAIPKSSDAKPASGNSEWRYTDGIIQPSVISLGGKHLRLYARSTARTGRVCVADSYDDGKTWTQARPLEVLNPNSGIDAVALKDGRVVLIYNDTSSGRSPLNLAVSKDGEKFSMFHKLENTPGGEFSYPNIIQGKDGNLHITYTWNRKKIKYVKFKLGDVPK